MKKILVINPGTTSTKIAVYHDEEIYFKESLQHTPEDLAQYPTIASQFDYRKNKVTEALRKENIAIEFDIIVARGGLTKPVASGVYEVNEQMIETLKEGKYGVHACNLGSMIAYDIAKETGCKAVIADPGVVDELQDVARVSGLPELPRVSIFHALNQKAVARRYAKETGRRYEELNLVIAHMGGGCTVGAHQHGKTIDVNNGTFGDGPFSIDRVGSMAAVQLMELCYSGKYTRAEMKEKLAGKGGIMAHMGISDAYQVGQMAKAGDKHAQLIYDAMAYNIGKEIGAKAAVLKGKVDAIILTGGVANSDYICKYIEDMVSFIAPVKRYPGEDELGALAESGLRVLNGEKCLEYK